MRRAAAVALCVVAAYARRKSVLGLILRVILGSVVRGRSVTFRTFHIK